MMKKTTGFLIRQLYIVPAFSAILMTVIVLLVKLTSEDSFLHELGAIYAHGIPCYPLIMNMVIGMTFNVLVNMAVEMGATRKPLLASYCLVSLLVTAVGLALSAVGNRFLQGERDPEDGTLLVSSLTLPDYALLLAVGFCICALTGCLLLQPETHYTARIFVSAFTSAMLAMGTLIMIDRSDRSFGMKLGLMAAYILLTVIFLYRMQKKLVVYTVV